MPESILRDKVNLQIEDFRTDIHNILDTHQGHMEHLLRLSGGSLHTVCLITTVLTEFIFQGVIIGVGVDLVVALTDKI